MIFSAIDGATTVSTSAETRRYNTAPFDLLAKIMQTEGISLSPSDVGAATPFQCGIAGYIGYEAGNYIEKLPSKKDNAIGLPDIYLCFYGASYVMDHQTKSARVLGNDKEAVDALCDFVSGLDQAVIPAHHTPFTTIEKAHKHFKSTFSYDEYIHAVKRTLEYIAAGDIFQANITHRFESKFDQDPALLFDLLNRNNPAPYSAFIDGGDHQVVSCSPELFLANNGPTVLTRPIKGTRPRSDAPGEDARLRDELIASEKDSAEHIMIVDLERNDLGRVCKHGSVHVPQMRVVESFPRVHHLVSTVAGKLKKNITIIDVLKATFPGGSITGAPKIRSMEIINELENVPREIYTGAIGYIDISGNFQFNIAIRTLIIKKGKVYFSVGGGIVADSSPEDEYNETITKASNLMLCVEAMDREKKGSKNAVGLS
jgi:para-aminobenzoate synthetase component I